MCYIHLYKKKDIIFYTNARENNRFGSSFQSSQYWRYRKISKKFHGGLGGHSGAAPRCVCCSKVGIIYIIMCLLYTCLLF